MRALLSSFALALALVLTGCADELTTDAATAGSASSTPGCFLFMDGPLDVDAYDTVTYFAEAGGGADCAGAIGWSVAGDATVISSTDSSVTVQAGADGNMVLEATNRKAQTMRTVPITPFPAIYDVDAGWAIGGTALDWWDNFPGCDQDPADYRYSVRRLVVSGPPLPPEFVNFDSDGCSAVDAGLYLSSDPGERRIRYLVRTFRNGVRVSTGQTPILEMDLTTDE